MLLKVCLPYIKDGATERLCNLAKEIGVYQEGMTTDEGADAFVTAINILLDKLNLQTPEEYKIDKDEFFKQIPKMTTDAIASGSPGNAINTPSEEVIQELYKKLWM